MEIGDSDFEDNEFNNLMNNINNENNINIINYLNDAAQIPLKRKYHVRERRNPFDEYDEVEFLRRFRFSKAEVTQVYDLIDGRRNLEPLVNNFQFNTFGIA